MMTLLVGLDNPQKLKPALALFPHPEGSTGDRLVQLIGEHLGNYSATSYLADFARTNLYPARRAPESRAKVDRDAMGHVEILAETIHATDVVLLGQRVVEAFNGLNQSDLTWLDCRVLPFGPRRWWALPQPSARNRWYESQANRAAAAELLARLRGGRLEVVNG